MDGRLSRGNLCVRQFPKAAGLNAALNRTISCDKLPAPTNLHVKFLVREINILNPPEKRFPSEGFIKGSELPDLHPVIPPTRRTQTPESSRESPAPARSRTEKQSWPRGARCQGTGHTGQASAAAFLTTLLLPKATAGIGGLRGAKVWGELGSPRRAIPTPAAGDEGNKWPGDGARSPAVPRDAPGGDGSPLPPLGMSLPFAG